MEGLLSTGPTPSSFCPFYSFIKTSLTLLASSRLLSLRGFARSDFGNILWWSVIFVSRKTASPWRCLADSLFSSPVGISSDFTYSRQVTQMRLKNSPERPYQKSTSIISPPATVPIARQTCKSILSDTVRFEPSSMPALTTPPAW